MANFIVIHRGVCPEIFTSESRILSYLDQKCAASSSLKDVLDGYTLDKMQLTRNLDTDSLNFLNDSFNVNDFDISPGTDDIDSIIKTAGFLISHNFKRYKIFVTDLAKTCFSAGFDSLTKTADKLRNEAMAVMLIPATIAEIQQSAGYIQGNLCFNRTLFPRDCFYLDKSGYCAKPGLPRILCIEVPNCKHYTPFTTFYAETRVKKGKDKMKHFSYPFSLFLLVPVSDDKTQLLDDDDIRTVMLPGFSALPD